MNPSEIAARQFRTGLRGYDQGEVDAFLDEVAAALTDVQTRLRERTEQVAMLQGQLEEMRRSSGDARMSDAQRDAEGILAQAEQDAGERRREVERELGELAGGLGQFRERLQSMTAAQIAALERIETLLRPR